MERYDLSRFHEGECARKWRSFQGSATPVTLGTVVQYAKEQGYRPDWGGCQEDYALDWDAAIGEQSEPDALLDLIELALPEKENERHNTAWRVEGTLREFPRFEPVNVWFDYPIHQVDEVGFLKEVLPEDEKPAWQKKAGQSKGKTKQQERLETLEKAFAACDTENTGCVSLAQLINYTGKSKNTIRDYVDEHPGFERTKDGVKRVKNDNLAN